MKHYFLLAGLVLCSFLPAAGDTREKSMLEFYISENVEDKSLKKTETSVNFHFASSPGGVVKSGIKMSYNGTNQTLNPDNKGNASLKLKPGKYVFKFFLNSDYFEITSDSVKMKGGYRVTAQVNFRSSAEEVICDKPVIYVYPPQSTEINITLDVKGKLDFTYPKYENGWKFTADPDGTIHLGGREYDYLFWDGRTEIETAKVNWNEGFIVGKEKLVAFFEEKLGSMGLNPREIQDYITYWCPRMNANESNYIHFMFNETYNDYASLNVSPKPDNQFRVFMIWSKAEGTEQPRLQSQEIPTFNRTGFTLVEWGGAEMNKLPKTVQ
ncbi:MAG: hypothetical protein FD123_2175 [Bacteroidetes bacterium]|nr:MAG: hypothetical protein FD123_2175 [Bacteroidota bacterium]